MRNGSTFHGDGSPDGPPREKRMRKNEDGEEENISEVASFPSIEQREQLIFFINLLEETDYSVLEKAGGFDKLNLLYDHVVRWILHYVWNVPYDTKITGKDKGSNHLVLLSDTKKTVLKIKKAMLNAIAGFLYVHTVSRELSKCAKCPEDEILVMLALSDCRRLLKEGCLGRIFGQNIFNLIASLSGANRFEQFYDKVSAQCLRVLDGERKAHLREWGLQKKCWQLEASSEEDALYIKGEGVGPKGGPADVLFCLEESKLRVEEETATDEDVFKAVLTLYTRTGRIIADPHSINWGLDSKDRLRLLDVEYFFLSAGNPNDSDGSRDFRVSLKQKTLQEEYRHYQFHHVKLEKTMLLLRFLLAVTIAAEEDPKFRFSKQVLLSIVKEDRLSACFVTAFPNKNLPEDNSYYMLKRSVLATLNQKTSLPAPIAAAARIPNAFL